MAPGGYRFCPSPRQNLHLIDLVEDELAKDLGSFEGPHSGNTSPAPFCNLTLGPKLVPTLIPALVSTPAPSSSDELFKQFIRAYLELN